MADTLFFDHLNDYPSDRQAGWAEDVQGVTHDEDHWYILQTDRLWKIPVEVDLNSNIHGTDASRGILSAPIPEISLSEEHLFSITYDHMGAGDYYDGALYIPLEKKVEYRNNMPIYETIIPVIARLDPSNLGPIDFVFVNRQPGHAPWCAVNPANGILYSSLFDEVSRIYAYQYPTNQAGGSILELPGQDIHLKDENGDSFKLSAVQGGVFTTNEFGNNLYLSSDSGDNRGVHVFDVATGRRFQYIDIEGGEWTFGSELEGLTFWDLDERNAPGKTGQLHVLELDNDTFTADDIEGFKHYRARRAPFIANISPSKMEVHKSDCEWVTRMNPAHKKAYHSLTDALQDGFDGCYFCLPQHNTR